MIGKLYINGTIGEDVDVVHIVNQFKALENPTELEVHINSVGGYVDVGFAIHDYLKGLNLPIHTIAENMCASIATVIFLSGTKRTVMQNCEFMIHAPMVQPDFALNSRELKEWSEGIGQTEKQLINFYTKNTKLTKEDLDALFYKDTFLNDEQLKNFGFTTQEAVQLRPVAMLKMSTNTNTNNMTNEDKSWFENQLKSLAKMFTPAKAKAVMYQDANGITVEFPEVSEGTLPVIGDTATVDGEPAEGSYVMPQFENATFVFVGGALTEIVEENDELDVLKAENEQLKADLAQAIAQLGTAKKSFENFKTQVQSKFNVDTRQDNKKEDKKEVVRKIFKD